MAMMWGSACHSHLASEAVLTRRGRSFEKLGSASEECGDTPERGRWALGLCAGVCQHRLAKNLVDDMGMRGGPCNRCSEHFPVVSHAVFWYVLTI